MTGFAPLDPSIAVALLAAGQAKRFGGDKRMARLGGHPLWTWAARAARAAGFARRLLVHPPGAAPSGAEAGEWLLVPNEAAGEGLASSLRAAVGAASEAERLVIVLGDMPFVEPALLRALATGTGVLFTRHPDGRRGAPAGFPRAAFPAFAELSGHSGASAVDWPGPVALIGPREPDSLFDIDTLDDLAAARSLASKRAPLVEGRDIVRTAECRQSGLLRGCRGVAVSRNGG